MAAEPTAKPRFGRLDLRYSVRNQSDDEVMSFSFSVLARRRESEDADGH